MLYIKIPILIYNITKVKEIQLQTEKYTKNLTLEFGGRSMIDQWTADVITKLRMLGISQKEFAKICGYSEPYMSQVLRGRKNTDQARQTIQTALDTLTCKKA